MKTNETEIERQWSYMHVCLPPNRQIGIHARPSWELSLVITGEGERSIGGVRTVFSAGDLVLVVPNMEHGWEFREDVTDAHGNIECITLNWTTQLMQSLLITMPEWEPTVTTFTALKSSLSITGSHAKQIIRLLHDMDRQVEAEKTITLLKIILLLAQTKKDAEVINKTSPLSPTEQRMQQIEHFSTCNYSRQITLGEVAKHVGMNRSAFCVFFRKQTGQTFMEYLNGYRIRVAGVTLLNTDQPISTICYQCGFNDIGYFDRLFKRHFGMTPNAYRTKKKM